MLHVTRTLTASQASGGVCELHVAEGFRWDASLALPVSRYGATVRNLSVCDFTIAPHLTFTYYEHITQITLAPLL